MRIFSPSTLRATIIDFIAVRYRAEWKDVLAEFEVDSKMAFYALLKDRDKLKDLMPRFNKVCNLTMEEFKENYWFIQDMSDNPQGNTDIRMWGKKTF